MKKYITLSILILTLSACVDVVGLNFDEQTEASQNNYEFDVAELQDLALEGNLDAQMKLASIHSSDDMNWQNYEQALQWYTLAAEQGNLEAQENVGRMYLQGTGTRQNYEQAVKWFSIAAERGFAYSQSNLGAMYANGQGVPQNDAIAYMWLSLGVLNGDQNNADKKVILATRLTPKQIEQAEILIQECIKKNYLGCTEFFYNELNPPTSLNAGINAMERGDGATGERIFRYFAEQGNIRAQSLLGEIYYNGFAHSVTSQGALKLISPDYQEALKWLAPAAYADDIQAQVILGDMYLSGKGIQANTTQAIKWYSLAAEQGKLSAQSFLGRVYFEGDGVLQDYSQAVKWYRLAAEQGDADAQYHLSAMYANGWSISTDFILAHVWGNLANLNGNSNGAEIRDSVAILMTTNQIQRAQNLARECIEKKYKGC